MIVYDVTFGFHKKLQVDVAYAPFIERYHPFLLDVKKYDIKKGRPKLAAWIEEMDKIEAYKQTRHDPKELVEIYKKRFLVFPVSYTLFQSKVSSKTISI